MSRDANPDTLYVSAPFRTPLGAWAVSLGRVIVDDQGRFNGYLLAIVDPDYFRLLLSTTVYAPDMRATVIHADGGVIFRAPDPENLIGQDLRTLPQSLYRRFLDSGADRAVLQGLAASGGERLMALQTIRPPRTPADKPLVVAISRDRAAVFAPWLRETLIRLGLIAMISLVAAIGLSAYQHRQRVDARRRMAEEARREQDAERLRLATDGAELGVWYWDMAAERLEWSERCKRHVGLPAGEEPSFEAFYAHMHPDDRDRVRALVDQAVASRSEYAAEYRVRWVDGSEHWISAPGRVYTHPDGSLRGMGGITQDITARKRSERDEAMRSRVLDLLAKGAALPAVLEAIVAGVEDARPTWLTSILLLAEDGRHLLLGAAPSLPAFYNEAMQGLPIGPDVGSCGAAAWLGQRVIAADLRTHPHWQSFRDLTARAGLGACWSEPIRGSHGHILGTFALYQHTVAEPTAEDLDLIARAVSLTAVAIERSQSLQALADLNRDLERKVAERTAEANAANRAKSEFLSHMSHEIRTPMNGVLGLTQVLVREPLTDEQHDLVARIQGAGQSLLAIINDILDFSKIEAGQLRLETRPFRLECVVHKVDSLLRPAACLKELKLRIEQPAERLGPLLGDALRLEQVLLNLIGNAIKFTERGTVSLRVIALEAGEHSVRLRFEVRDSGIGMDPATLAGLFQPFTQADAGITRRFGGTGLGLTISKRLVECMDGTIEVESREGVGSTFWFELSFARTADDTAANATSSPAGTATEGPRLRGGHYLIVDDNALNLDVLERMLELEGARATRAADGRAALARLRSGAGDFDAVLMDVKMPVLDGLSATRALRGKLGLIHLPVIAVTAGVLMDEQQRAYDAGVDALLPKPVELDQLVAILRRWPPGAADGLQADAARAAAAGSAPGTAALPAIEGLDQAHLARLTQGDIAFCRRLLSGLATEARDVPGQVRAALAQGARSEAAAHLHRLRGVAANIGAVTLAAAIQALETALNEAGPVPAALKEAFALQVTRLLASIAAWLAQTEPAPSIPLTVEDAPLDPTLIAALREALATNRPRPSRQSFAELQAGLSRDCGTAATQAIATALDAFDFPAALRALDAALAGKVASADPDPRHQV